MAGEYAPQSFTGGYIALSFAISVIGSLTTLELLQRRTAGRGLYNWFLLVGSAVTMGGIAIWSMHFIGNRAIVLSPGDMHVELAYNATYTSISFFMPVLVLILAYALIGTGEAVSVIRVIVGGTVAGIAIVGMHYLGQNGITNFRSTYNVAFVVASVIIAVVASVVALSIFFVLRAKWLNSWWKRVLLALLLAGAVSGMHWCAACGTAYWTKEGVDLQNGSAASRQKTTIVTIVLAVAACVFLLALAIMTGRKGRLRRDRAEQIVLAAAMFDDEGRLMVSADGMIPCRKITNQFNERSFDEQFGNSHPVFLWLYRATRNWGGIMDLMPSMRNHLRSLSQNNQSVEYSILFREMFCVAAEDLAEYIHEPLPEIGALYNEIVHTGSKSRKRPTPTGSTPDLENSPHHASLFGKGKFLFLVKQADRVQAAKLQASGFRFANVRQVTDLLSNSLQIPRDDFLFHMDAMRSFVDEAQNIEPGVHIGCFAVKANTYGGFSVLVDSKRKTDLPTMKMPTKSLRMDILNDRVGMTVNTILKDLKSSIFQTVEDQSFANNFVQTLQDLIVDISDPFFEEAVLVPDSFPIPCSTTRTNAGVAQLIIFKAMVPIHGSVAFSSRKFGATPLNLFIAQQRVFPDSEDHEIFGRKAHREFSGLLEKSALLTKTTVTHGHSSSTERLQVPSKFSLTRWSSHSASNVNVRDSSNESRPSTAEKKLVSENPFANIMVSQSVSVNVTEAKSQADVEMNVMSTAYKEDEEQPCWVNDLFEDLIQREKRQ